MHPAIVADLSMPPAVVNPSTDRGTDDATAAALAAAERIRPQSMAATLAALEQQGLVERRPDPDDGRRQVVSLSTAGRARIDGDRAARQEWLAREFAEKFTEAERRTLLDALSLLDRLL